MNATVWLVEDSLALRDELSWELMRFGFGVRAMALAEDALRALGQAAPDLFIVDAVMPDMSVEEFCSRLGPDSAPPVMLIAADAERAAALLAAQPLVRDYLVKPFLPQVLVTRLASILERLDQPGDAPKALLRAAGPPPTLHCGPDARVARVDGRNIPLAPTEHRLLCYLLSRKGEVLSRAQLLEAIWETSEDDSKRSVDVTIVSLRRKLGRAGNCIRTVRGVGYKLADNLI